jgi:hypoxanthine phosphoribosyltransferase
MESGGKVPAPWASQVGEVLIGSTAIARRVSEIGDQLTRDYDGQNPVLVVVLKGSFIFAADLSRAILTPHEVQFIRAQSYSGTESCGTVRITGLEGVSLNNRQVIVVEDIVDTGLTAMELMRQLANLGAASVKLCTLLSKETARRKDNSPRADYIAFSIPDKFVVGYGLDHDQMLRHLPFVGIKKI